MWHVSKAAIAIVIFFFWLSVPAQAQQANCGDRATMMMNLAEKWQETRQAIGLVSPTAMVEIFANLETGTWSFLYTGANGLMCLITSGKGYQHMDAEPEAQGSAL